MQFVVLRQAVADFVSPVSSVVRACYAPQLRHGSSSPWPGIERPCVMGHVESRVVNFTGENHPKPLAPFLYGREVGDM